MVRLCDFLENDMPILGIFIFAVPLAMGLFFFIHPEKTYDFLLRFRHDSYRFLIGKDDKVPEPRFPGKVFSIIWIRIVGACTVLLSAFFLWLLIISR